MMRTKMGWWRWTAVVLSLATVVVFVGIVVDPDDSGSMAIRAGFATLAVTGAVLVGLGVLKRETSPNASLLLALGMVPAFGLIMFFWFPPVALAGVLAIVVATVAASDHLNRNRAETAPDTTLS